MEVVDISLKKVPIAEPALNEKDVAYVSEAIRSSWISGRGRYVAKFEGDFVKWLGADFGVATSSGTTALHLALATLGIGAGDEVVVPAFSMASIPFAVSYTGAKPILADSEWSTWNIDPNKIEEKVTERTKAIVVMHTYGHPVNMNPVLKIARNYNLYVIEDAAEAHGAEYKNKKVGTIGNIGCFSFFANKIITTGEGGMLVTHDPEIAEKASVLRDMAFDRDPSRKFLHKYIGFNYRLTNIQAALGLAQLERIDEFVNIRRKNAQIYNKLLKNVEGILTPPEANWAKNVYWMYSILIDEEIYGRSRDQLMESLKEEYNIETRPFFVPISQQPPYEKLFRNQKYPIAEKLSIMGLNLPSGNTLTKEQVEYVASAIASLGKR